MLRIYNGSVAMPYTHRSVKHAYLILFGPNPNPFHLHPFCSARLKLSSGYTPNVPTERANLPASMHAIEIECMCTGG